ncbi:MAG: archaemetzincin [Planctomycetota bacterium]|jgi:archaemetzincin
MSKTVIHISLPIILIGVLVIIYSCVLNERNEEAIFDMMNPPSDNERRDGLFGIMDILRPLHRELGAPQSGDWLDRYSEPGQTFMEYMRCVPERPLGERKIIYIQPLGNFNDTQKKIVELTADFMGAYFNLEVRIRETLPPGIIPASARRVHPSQGMRQILSTYVLNDVLKPRLPEDAAAYIAFTTTDLWPGRGWNFVFGQASLRERVGVWSIYRNGNPVQSGDTFKLCLLRTIKTATHETGHMFSMYHCTAYECNMCGSNHREESDRRPLACCPECMAKICWAVRCDPIPRYKKLAGFCEEHGLEAEHDFFIRSIKAIEAAEKTGE